MSNSRPPQTSFQATAYVWLRKNLFNNWWNGLLTIGCVFLLLSSLIQSLNWLLNQAQWRVIQANFVLFFVGRYPSGEYWRTGVVFALLLGLPALVIQASLVKRQFTQTGFQWQSPWLVTPVLLTGLAVLLLFLGGGGVLRPVNSSLWNGMMLTLFLAECSIFLAFPLGVLLALGRQSDLPVIRWFCIIYIEVIRGLPLVGILFMAQVMLSLLLPSGLRLDRVLRAIAGFVIFNSAYLAENVRGGLQAIPKGQVEAARALGMNGWSITQLVVLPQALRLVIPAIVGQFISLFKDTSLASIFAILELTGMARSILAQPQFIGRYGEVYLFIGALYWLFCYGMSRFSQQLEKYLGVSARKS